MNESVVYEFSASCLVQWQKKWWCLNHLSMKNISVSHCDRTSRRNAKTKTWLSCSPWSMLTLSAGRRRKKSSLHSKNELWDFSHHKIQLSLGLLSVYFWGTFYTFPNTLNWSPKMFRHVSFTSSIHLCVWFSGETSGWKSRTAEDSCWEGQGATGQTWGMTPQHG